MITPPPSARAHAPSARARPPEKGAPQSQQGPVEVGVDTGKRHGPLATVAMVEWRLGDSRLDLTFPVAAGIVNVTVDSMYEGARSGSPEQAIRDGLALAEAGFEMLDVGAVAARSGPPVSAEDECAALLPAIAGMAAAAPVSA